MNERCILNNGKPCWSILLTIFIILSYSFCKNESKQDPIITQSDESHISLNYSDFTSFEDIDPSIYFATEENMAADPNDQLMEVFRKKKASDIDNPDKPRPFPESELGQIENISHEQPWGSATELFQFEWDKIESKQIEYFNKTVRARMIFDNADLKVTELALAPKAILPTHAQPSPSVYFILGGEAEILSDSSAAKVYTGTSIKFDSYSKKRIENSSEYPLKILWFSWAPEGNRSYLESGYYLTGSNPHIQSINAVLPEEFKYWDEAKSKRYELINFRSNQSEVSSFVAEQKRKWEERDIKQFYANTSNYKSAGDVEWVDVMNMDPKSFFFADDLKSLGSTLEMMSKLAKIKSVFRAVRPDGGYDLNYSFLAWGPQSKYITHSHAICEFYYILEGDVEYIINGKEYHGVPGNFYFHPPYFDHEMRGLKKDVPFLSISGSWIPYGRRELLEQPFLLLEDIRIGKSPGFPNGFNFHDFDIKKEGVEYGKL